MLRTTQLRFVAIVLSAVAAASLTNISARAFSLGNGGTTGGGNAAFADPDEQVGKMFGLDQGGEPSKLSSPAQFDPSRASQIHTSTFTSTALLRLPILFPARATEPSKCYRGFNLVASPLFEHNKKPDARTADGQAAPDRPSTRPSSRRQSLARSSMTRTMRGDRTSCGVANMRGNSARKKRNPCRTAMPRSNRKARI